MRRSIRHVSSSVLVAVIVAALGAPSAAARPSRPGLRLGTAALRPKTVPGEVVVGYKRSADLRSTRAAVAAFGARRGTGARRTDVLRLHRGVSVESAIAALESDPAVSFAEPNLVRYPLEVVPNDASFADQWALKNTGQAHVISGSSTQALSGTPGADMKVTHAWDTTQGSEDTIVAILDSGVDVSHPDLADNIWVNPGEIPANGVDDDGNGYVDDVNGWDFAEQDDTLLETDSSYFGFDHGTHVAGTVAGVADNGIGISGVCPKCKIMVLKIFEPFDTDSPPDGIKDTMLGDIASGIEAIQYAIEMGADVVNGSLGAPLFWSKAERRVLRKAIKAGVSPVFAAGNERGDNDIVVIQDFDRDGVPDSLSPSYPASYDLPGLISVAASNHRDENGYSSLCALQRGSQDWRCSFTNFGHESVDLSAPGVDILSTVPGGYAAFDGTSMSAPHIAGVVGLIRSAHPGYTPRQVRSALLNSVARPAGLSSLFSFPGNPATGQFTVTGGRADAQAALSASTDDRFPRTDGSIRGAKRIRSFRRGTVAWPEDSNDVYRKRLRKGSRYTVVLDGPADADFDLVIYKPGVKEIWQFEMGCFQPVGGCKVLLPYAPQQDADESRTFKAKRTGRHFFHVSAYLFQSGAYRLKVRKV